MFNFVKWPAVLTALFLYGYVPLVSADTSVNRELVTSLEEMLPALVSSENYRAASNVAFQLASAHKRLGETSAACAAISQSFENYRKALAKEAGALRVGSSIDDDADVLATLNHDSDGMTEVRTRFGCTRA